VTSLDRLITNKSKAKETTAPVLTVNDAVVEIISAEMQCIGDVITKNDGDTFVIDKPAIACELELVDAPKRKKGDIGTRWFEKFYFPKTEKGSGVYENRPKTKIGNLSEARYGEGFWEDPDAVLDPEDLESFKIYCNLEPKTEFGGTKVIGTKIDHKTIEALEPEAEEERLPEDAPEAPEFPKGEGN
jgi:hypothetical protein